MDCRSRVHELEAITSKGRLPWQPSVADEREDCRFWSRIEPRFGNDRYTGSTQSLLTIRRKHKHIGSPSLRGMLILTLKRQVNMIIL